MLRLICSILFICLTLFSSAQGNWNIGYIPVDSLTKEHVGRLVRPDFKSPKKVGKSLTARNTRSYVRVTDTGVINIDSAFIKVAERRKIYADHGNYNDQYLECLDYKGLILRLYDAEILDVDDRSILLRIETSVSLKDSVRSGKSMKVIQVELAKLDGVMFQLSKSMKP